MDYTVIISTIRPNFFEFAQRCIDSIHKEAKNCPYSYEIIVVSPFEIPEQYGIRSVEEKESTGSIAAYNLGAKEANGDYIVITPDDWFINENWWLAKEKLEKIPGKCKICSLATIKVAQIPFPGTFCMPRTMVNSDLMKGNLFNPVFFHQVADNDLGCMLHYNNIPMVDIGNLPYSFSRKDHYDIIQKNKYVKIDEVIFYLLWHKIYGIWYQVDLNNHEIFDVAQERISKFSLWSY